MFYSNNEGYMQDLYFYNQLPNNTYMNTFGNNMQTNPNVQLNPAVPMQNNMMFQNPGLIPNTYSAINLRNLYPSIYKILSPVITRVVSNNNQPITDDLLNNMTDTVFNIVEGQIDLKTETKRTSPNENQQQNSSSNNLGARTSEPVRQNSQMQQADDSRSTTCDTLLKDLIKILIIKELLLKQSYQREFGSNYGMPNAGYIPYCNNLNF